MILHRKRQKEPLVSCLSLPPLPTPPNPLSKVQWSWKLQFVSFPRSPFPCVSFCRLFSRPRWDTSAMSVSLHRKRWPPADTSRWPPSPAPSRLHQSFSCTNGKQKHIQLSTSRHSFDSQTTEKVIQWLTFQFQQLPSGFGAYKPFHEEHELSCGICGSNNPFWIQPSSEAP